MPNVTADEMSWSYGEPGDSTGRTLIDALKGGDAKAWERIVEVWGPALLVYFRRRGFRQDDAADLVQIVLAKMYRGIPNFERDGRKHRLVHWVYCIAKREAATYRQRVLARLDPCGGSDHQRRLHAVADATDAGDEISLQSEVMARLMKVVAADFAPKTWQAFWRVSVDGLTAVEAAAELATSAEAVRAGNARIRRRLREELCGFPAEEN